jgi:hypothetical protein
VLSVLMTHRGGYVSAAQIEAAQDEDLSTTPCAVSAVNAVRPRLRAARRTSRLCTTVRIEERDQDSCGGVTAARMAIAYLRSQTQHASVQITNRRAMGRQLVSVLERATLQVSSQ